MCQLDSVSYLVAGDTRSAVISRAGVSNPASAPTVLFFHGRGAKAETAAKAGRIRKAWPEATVIYPQGLPNDSGVGPPGIGWQRGFGITRDRDLAFVKQILLELPEDGGKRYACGVSNGGTFALLLMAALPEAFDAFAEVSGAAGRFLTDIKVARPAMLINGRSDRILPFWAAQKVAERLLQMSGAREDGCEGDLKTWSTADNEAFLVQWAHPGGHLWPKEADERIVEFFRKH